MAGGGRAPVNPEEEGMERGNYKKRRMSHFQWGSSNQEQGSSHHRYFEIALVVLEVVWIILFSQFVEYGKDNALADFYSMFQDVHVMIYIGFGFLMTFPFTYMWSAVALNMLLAAFAFQLSILTNEFWHQVFQDNYHDISVDVVTLVTSDFAAASVLIAFGVLLGRASYIQMLFAAICCTILFGLNENIGFELEISDVGGSMIIHTFGAYFGLACSWALSLNRPVTIPAPRTTRYSDTFSMLGSIFLWMYWPSFNSVLVSGSGQSRAVVNTVFSMTGSTLAAFVTSTFCHGKFAMVDVQNGILAGGVAVGAIANLDVGIWAAVLTGFVAGAVCVLGYTYLTPALTKHLGLHDTCGVHNLHGMSGVIGGLASVIAAATIGNEVDGEHIGTVFPARGNGRSSEKQATHQLAMLVITLCIAIFGGVLTGFFMRYLPAPPTVYNDSHEWHKEGGEVQDDEDDKGEDNGNTNDPTKAAGHIVTQL